MHFTLFIFRTFPHIIVYDVQWQNGESENKLETFSISIAYIYKYVWYIEVEVGPRVR